MERLSPLSYVFLVAEDVDPAACLVIGSMAVLEGPAPPLEDVRRVVEERLSSAPRYRDRVVPDRLGLRAPAWVEADDLDISRHVVSLAVPPPGGREELAALVADRMARRMDRSRPLWDLAVCEGLPGGQWGLLSRVHHALADGVSGTGLYRVVFDTEGPVAETPPGVARTGVAAAALAAARGAVALGTSMWPVRSEGLLGPLDGERRYGWVEVGIGASAAARHHLGVTLNDLVLASVAGGLRELLLERGRQPSAHALRTLLPVSSRLPGTAGLPDNQVTLMLSLLPVEVDDPVERVLAVHRRVTQLRGSHEPEAGVALQALAAWVPFPLLHLGMRWTLRLPQQQITTVTTNVPGPRSPMTCLGRPVRQLLPVVPIADRVRLGFAVLSYVDTLTFGITADSASTPDLDLLTEAIDASWHAVVGSAVTGGPAGDW